LQPISPISLLNFSRCSKTCRASYHHLPKLEGNHGRRINVKAISRHLVGAETNVVSHYLGSASPSELLLGDTKRIEVPVIKGRKPKPIPFISRGELDQIQADTGQIVLPSNYTRLNTSFGEKSNGKLKAAEWRSLFAVYLPISCMCMWANSSITSNRMMHLKSLLALTIIVKLTCSTSSSTAGAKLYDEAIRYYLTFVKTLQQHTTLSPFRPSFIGLYETAWSLP
jgi:hypothetical protein